MRAITRLTAVLAAAAYSLAAAGPPSLAERKAAVRALLEKEDFTGALTQSQAIQREIPDDVETYGLMTAAYLELGDYDAAETQLQWMLDLRIGKPNLEGWLLLARFRETTGDPEGALEALSQASGRISAGEEPDRRKLMAVAGRLYFEMGKLELADRALLAAGGAEGDGAERLALARLRAAQGRRGEAIAMLRQWTERETDPRTLYVLAGMSGLAADYARFERSALAVSAETRNANRELALYYAERGRKPARALELASGAAAARQDARTLDALAVALLANGRKTEAQKAMRRALASGTRDAEILQHAAQMGVSGQ